MEWADRVEHKECHFMWSLSSEITDTYTSLWRVYLLFPGSAQVNWKLGLLNLIVEISQFSKVLSNFLVVRNTMKSRGFHLTPLNLCRKTPCPDGTLRRPAGLQKRRKEKQRSNIWSSLPLSPTLQCHPRAHWSLKLWFRWRPFRNQICFCLSAEYDFNLVGFMTKNV